MKKKTLQTGFGGIFDKGENLFAAHWAMDNNVSNAFTCIEQMNFDSYFQNRHLLV